MRPTIIFRPDGNDGWEFFVSDGDTEIVVPMSVRAIASLQLMLSGAIYLKVK
jgi:hypothetical protein